MKLMIPFSVLFVFAGIGLSVGIWFLIGGPYSIAYTLIILGLVFLAVSFTLFIQFLTQIRSVYTPENSQQGDAFDVDQQCKRT